MKKILAFAFVAGMISFVACTSKPSETEAVEETQVEETVVEPVEVEAEADTVAADTTGNN